MEEIISGVFAVLTVFLILLLYSRINELQQRKNVLEKMNNEYSRIIRMSNILGIPPKKLRDEDLED